MAEGINYTTYYRLSMDFVDILERGPDESEELEYKDKRADPTSIVKDLVAMANSSGGALLYGVRESNGEIEEIQDITDFSQFEESLNQTISSRVDPILPVKPRTDEYNGFTVVGIEVEHRNLLHSLDSGNGKPCIPTRVGSTTDYLGGAALREFYRSRFESADSGLTGWLDEVRKQVHRITYAYRNDDFAEVAGRGHFARKSKEVVGELQTKLEQPHRELGETTAQLMEKLVDAWVEMSDVKISANSGVTLIGRDSTKGGGYAGGTPEEIETAFREKAEIVNEAAVSLESHLKN